MVFALDDVSAREHREGQFPARGRSRRTTAFRRSWLPAPGRAAYTTFRYIECRVSKLRLPHGRPAVPGGYRYALHYGYTDGRGTILRYGNENETPGRHERYTPNGVEEIDFPGMVDLRDRFLNEIEEHP